MDETLMDIAPLAAQGFCCSQIIVQLALRAQGRENQELARALSGLCRGLGASRETGCGACGILTGGACALALYTGRGTLGEEPHERAELIQSEFVDWFITRTRAQYGGSSCQDILGDDSGRPDMTRCGNLLAEAWGKVVEILTENGLDVTEGRDA